MLIRTRDFCLVEKILYTNCNFSESDFKEKVGDGLSVWVLNLKIIKEKSK